MNLHDLLRFIYGAITSFFGISSIVNNATTKLTKVDISIGNMPKLVKNDSAILSFVKSSNAFASDLYKELAFESKNSNLICSSISAHTVLTLLAYGANGLTAEQMIKVLHLTGDKDKALLGNYLLKNHIKDIKNVSLYLADRIYITDEWIVRPNYKKTVDNVIPFEIAKFDTADFSKSVKRINLWVKNKTNSTINEILKEGDIDSDDSIIILNAIYFKANWALSFDKQKTSNETFHTLTNKQIKVPTMYVQGFFVYGTSSYLNAKYIEIPYENNSLKMVIIVPNEKNGLTKLQSRLENYNFSETSKFAKRKISLHLPKFKIDKHIDLQSTLKQLGMAEMFSSAADFSGLSNGPLYVSQVVQRAFIEVDETGTRAAAASMLQRIIRSVAAPTTVRVNVSFYFAIRSGHLTLFQGHVVDPTMSQIN